PALAQSDGVNWVCWFGLAIRSHCPCGSGLMALRVWMMLKPWVLLVWAMLTLCVRWWLLPSSFTVPSGASKLNPLSRAAITLSRSVVPALLTASAQKCQPVQTALAESVTYGWLAPTGDLQSATHLRSVGLLSSWNYGYATWTRA